MATKVVAVALIQVSPDCYQDDTSELRHDIAQLARQGSIAPDANEPLALTLCFLVQQSSWDRARLYRHPVTGFYTAFQRWAGPNPVAHDITQPTFDRQLRQFLQASALSFTINTEIGLVVQAEGLRLQPRTAREQEVALLSLARLDHPAF